MVRRSTVDRSPQLDVDGADRQMKTASCWSRRPSGEPKSLVKEGSSYEHRR